MGHRYETKKGCVPLPFMTPGMVALYERKCLGRVQPPYVSYGHYVSYAEMRTLRPFLAKLYYSETFFGVRFELLKYVSYATLRSLRF